MLQVCRRYVIVDPVTDPCRGGVFIYWIRPTTRCDASFTVSLLRIVECEEVRIIIFTIYFSVTAKLTCYQIKMTELTEMY